MKRLIKLFTVLLMLLSTVISVKAEDTTVTFKGEQDGFEFSNDGDLFADFKGCMPGDELTQIVKVINASEDTVKIYLQAVVHDETNQPVTAEATSDESNDFLKELSMTVINGREQIYEASPDKTDGLTEPVLLGQFAPGDEKDLTVTLSVPITLGNEFANREGEVDWIFTAVKLIDVTVTKIWEDNNNNDGYRPGSVTVKLLADGEEIAVYSLIEKENWKHTFEELPSADMEGKEIEYTIEETPVENYENPKYEKKDEKGYEWTVTNKHVNETVDIDVEIIWEDEDDVDKIRPDEVTVTVYDDEGNPVDEITVSADENWKDIFKDLPKYKDGKEIRYTVKQKPVKGYSTEVTGDMENGFIIINRHAPEPDTGDNNNLTLWFSLLGLATVGFAGILLLYLKKKRYQE